MFYVGKVWAACQGCSAEVLFSSCRPQKSFGIRRISCSHPLHSGDCQLTRLTACPMCHFPRTGNVDLTLRIATQSPQPFDLREAFPSRRSFSRLFVSLRTPAKPDITPLTFKIPHYTFYWNPNNPPQATSVFSAP